MTPQTGADVTAAEALVARYETRVALLREAMIRVRDGLAPDAVTAVCEVALGGCDVQVDDPVRAEAGRIATRLQEALGDPARALRYLVERRIAAFGGRTPYEVVRAGEVELLLSSLNAVEHGLGA